MAQTPLQSVKTFPQLLKYLEEELDWPIDEMDVEKLTFEYDAERDLGLDPKTAAKVSSIRQLRQIDKTQPFGIFFVEFEPKRLPVTVLRRLLAALVTRKRASANPIDRKTWDQDDLIFVSAYGEDAQRHMDFAHFADDAANGLPTLRVLGWDEDDTARRIDLVEQRLKEHLTWDDELSPEEWRIRWRSGFVWEPRQVPRTTRELVAAMAKLAIRIRDKALRAMASETARGPIRRMHSAFRDSLIHDLDEKGFADMYAQTITYGLLSARISRPAGLVTDDIAAMVTSTSPFLRELMEEFIRVGGRYNGTSRGDGIDFDLLGVNEVVELLRRTDMEPIVADFGRTRAGEDPVIHFYEDFMKQYDAQQRVKRGIYYTPTPVVSFIVRSVDEILREEFGLPLGLADTTSWAEFSKQHKEMAIPNGVKPTDHFVQILDPACGTGTFLVETIELIHNRMVEHWKERGCTEMYDIPKLWNDYVSDHLLPRLYGFELMMAPYAICHMKVGLKLKETGYRFRSSQRLRVYLANSLEPPHNLREMLEFVAPFLAHEARAANYCKDTLCPTIVLGNPPYANMSSNLGSAQRELVSRFKQIDGEPLRERNALQLERNVNDDYVKFIAASLNYLRAGPATFGMITNFSYSDATTLRGLRAELLRSFAKIDLLDLHGSSGSESEDANVFDIEQHVGILLAHRVIRLDARTRKVAYSSLRGSRDFKYQTLLAGASAVGHSDELESDAPWYLFIPQSSQIGWDDWPGIEEVLPIYAEGIKTGLDDVLIGCSPSELIEQLRDWSGSGLDADELRCKYAISRKGWGNSLIENRDATARLVDEELKRAPVRFQYRPLDYRFAFWPSRLLKAPSRVAGRHLMRDGSLALVCARQVSGPDDVTHFSVCRVPPDNRLFYSKKGTATYFPVTDERGHPTFDRKWVEFFGADTEHETAHIVALIYAIWHSPKYRRDYCDRLHRDFPHLPRPSSEVLSQLLISLGADLVALHLLEDDYSYASWNQPDAKNHNPLARPITDFVDYGNREVRKAAEKDKSMAASLDYGQGFGRVYINDTAYFDGVPKAVWNFHIGGYQVCHKWLKDRKGRTLSQDDIAHYHKIVVALNETIRLMKEIDEVIDQHGGWPGAFITDQ